MVISFSNITTTVMAERGKLNLNPSGSRNEISAETERTTDKTYLYILCPEPSTGSVTRLPCVLIHVGRVECP